MTGRFEELPDELFSGYLDGELSGDERRRVEEILEADADARARFDELRELQRRLRSLPRLTAPDDLRRRIARQIVSLTVAGDGGDGSSGEGAAPMLSDSAADGSSNAAPGAAATTVWKAPGARDARRRMSWQPWAMALSAVAASLLLLIVVPPARDPERTDLARGDATTPELNGPREAAETVNLRAGELADSIDRSEALGEVDAGERRRLGDGASSLAAADNENGLQLGFGAGARGSAPSGPQGFIEAEPLQATQPSEENLALNFIVMRVPSETSSLDEVQQLVRSSFPASESEQQSAQWHFWSSIDASVSPAAVSGQLAQAGTGAENRYLYQQRESRLEAEVANRDLDEVDGVKDPGESERTDARSLSLARRRTAPGAGDVDRWDGESGQSPEIAYVTLSLTDAERDALVENLRTKLPSAGILVVAATPVTLQTPSTGATDARIEEAPEARIEERLGGAMFGVAPSATEPATPAPPVGDIPLAAGLEGARQAAAQAGAAEAEGELAGAKLAEEAAAAPAAAPAAPEDESLGRGGSEATAGPVVKSQQVERFNKDISEPAVEFRTPAEVSEAAAGDAQQAWSIPNNANTIQYAAPVPEVRKQRVWAAIEDLTLRSFRLAETNAASNNRGLSANAGGDYAPQNSTEGVVRLGVQLQRMSSDFGVGESTTALSQADGPQRSQESLAAGVEYNVTANELSSSLGGFGGGAAGGSAGGAGGLAGEPNATPPSLPVRADDAADAIAQSVDNTPALVADNGSERLRVDTPAQAPATARAGAEGAPLDTFAVEPASVATGRSANAFSDLNVFYDTSGLEESVDAASATFSHSTARRRVIVLIELASPATAPSTGPIVPTAPAAPAAPVAPAAPADAPVPAER